MSDKNVRTATSWGAVAATLMMLGAIVISVLKGEIAYAGACVVGFGVFFCGLARKSFALVVASIAIYAVTVVTAFILWF